MRHALPDDQYDGEHYDRDGDGRADQYRDVTPVAVVPAEGYTTARPTLFGREPALLLNVVAAAVALLSSTVLPLTVGQQGALNTLATAACGVVIAIKVKGGTWAAALLTFTQALIAAALAWKLHLSPDAQSAVLLLVAAVGGYATRAVVTAPQPPAVPGSSLVA